MSWRGSIDINYAISFVLVPKTKPCNTICLFWRCYFRVYDLQYFKPGEKHRKFALRFHGAWSQ